MEKEETYSLSEGLKVFFERGSQVRKVRLNKRMKEILLILIEEDLENTCVYFDKDQEESYNEFMAAMYWMKKQITKKGDFNIRLNKRIGVRVMSFLHRHRHHYLSNEVDFDKAMQWMLNKINKHYSQGELSK